MARNKKSSPMEDFVDLASMLPWWASCTLALVAYLVLHIIASQAPAEIVPGQLASGVTRTIWKSLASIGQYLLPLLLLVSAAVSAFARQRRQRLFADCAGSTAADALNDLTWQEFELLVGEGFRRQGYAVTENGGGGADGGIDLVLRKDGEKFLVQCKQWKAFSVGVSVVRELHGAMAARGAAGGFVVTSGRFTEAAKAFAGGLNISLVDGPGLHALIRSAQAVHDRGERSSKAGTEIAPNSVVLPACPICTKSMVLRTAKRGDAPGNSFWGCSGFPSCRGTRQVG